jgi:hypothetical protein
MNKNKKNNKYYKNKKKDISKKDYFIEKYFNTSLLPLTSIIKFINSNYPIFLKEKEKDYNPTQFSFFFDTKNNFIKGNKIEINYSLEKNIQMNTDKLLAYALYLKSSDFFLKKQALDIKLLKTQIGKDTVRMPIYINSNLYTFLPKNGDMESSTNDEKADFFILKIMDNLSNLNEKIDYNLLNKIGISCCQNLFNLLIDQLTIVIMNAIKPEFCTFINGKKHVELFLTESSKIAKLFFTGNIIISYKQNIDPEFTCGKIDFILTIDYQNNNYYFEKFNLEYDVNLCNPNKKLEIQENNLEQVQINNQNNESKSNFNFSNYKYLIPAAAVTGAVISTPFILGVVGGKMKTRKYKKSKNFKKTRKYIKVKEKKNFIKQIKDK